MLKRIICVVNCLLILIYISFFSEPLGALSNNIVIYQLQTGSSSSATQEYISIKNKSLDPVDVTDWCVTKSSFTDLTQTQLGCLVPSELNIRLMLPPQGQISLATAEFIAVHNGFNPDIVFGSTLASTGGHIRIMNKSKQEIDKLGWGTAQNPENIPALVHSSGKILQRKVNIEYSLIDTDDNSLDFEQSDLTILPAISVYEEEIPVDLCPNINGFQIEFPDGYLLDNIGECRIDVCSNIAQLQIDIPDGYFVDENETCQLVPLENATLIINELLPNVTSYDTGKEFIELYNPNSRAIRLNGYALQVGPSFNKSYYLPDDDVIEPEGYYSISDTVSKLVLPNTSASLRLVAPDGSIVSFSDLYLSPGENTAWALISATWQYTNQPTSGAQNVASLEDPIESDVEVRTLGPCPTGQYRSPETNRCRLIQLMSSALVPCKAGQERNPETNRCRNVLGASTSLVPCKTGQERNPETNRCKNISTSNLVPCKAGQERNPDTNRCKNVGISGDAIPKVQDIATPLTSSGFKWWIAIMAILTAIGYAIYEWRHDLKNLIYKIYTKNHKS